MDIQYQLLFVLITISIGCVASVLLNKLTWVAGVWAFVIASFVYLGVGFGGIGMLVTFFITAIWATHHKKEQKLKLEISGQGTTRKAGQVLANGGIAGLMGLLVFLFPEHSIPMGLMLAASLSSATADTLASELGVVYGRNPINIISFKKDSKGRDGVISLEGTLIGIVGSILIALVFSAFQGFDWYAYIVIVVSGTVGNLADSLLGATLERRRIVDNNMVNLLNTVIAALTALALYWMMR